MTRSVFVVLVLLTLKNVMNTCDCEAPRRTTARKVVNPPLNTAGPMVVRAYTDLDKRDPKRTIYFFLCLISYKRKAVSSVSF